MAGPSLAYAGIPYQSLGVSSGALAMITSCTRCATERSGSTISAIFSSTAPSSSALVADALRALAVRTSLARSLIAARSSAEKLSSGSAGTLLAVFPAVLCLVVMAPLLTSGLLAAPLILGHRRPGTLLQN